jgi:hypothetical protein
MTERPGRPDDPDDPNFAPHEEAALAGAMRPVAGRGRGVTIAAVLIVTAFTIGVLRPWDWLLPGAASGPGGTGPDASSAVLSRATPTLPPGATPEPTARAPFPTCGYPESWRSATLQRWAGQRARVWTAVSVAPASRPDDPAVPFQVIAGEDFRAIGWCAPVSGEERPPSGAIARLYRIEDGVAVETPHVRLEPPASTALGELWGPVTTQTGATATWPLGRYVIELLTPDGTWSRYLGLELRSAIEPATPAPPPTPTALPTPSGEATPAPVDLGGSPLPTPGQTD